MYNIIFSFLTCTLLMCTPKQTQSPAPSYTLQDSTNTFIDTLVLGAERQAYYVPMLQGKTVAMVVNHTSTIGENHIVDSLLKLGVNIKRIMSPEHGFRGKADAGELVSNEKDLKTGLPIISLYGKRKKPLPEDVSDVDIVIFDIQDVGVRFYTYISTLHYVMETCAEQGKKLFILDRPNPNGHYTDGPVLDPAFKSFIGMHPVPIVHGMTIGEYARMVNGEGWLSKGLKCDLTIVECKNYTHNTFYELPVKPSPNLPNIRSIYLYPFICFFEGTNLSLGRGTEKQFQVIGHPKYKGDYSFTPQPNEGAKDPPLNGKLCKGIDLTELPIGNFRDMKHVNLDYLIEAHHHFKSTGEPFWLENHFIDKLAGSDQLRLMIDQGKTADQIKATWQPGLEKYRTIRNKYLLYN